MEATHSTFRVLTGPQPAGVAVIELRGKRVATFLGAHFSGKLAVGRPSYGELRNGSGELVDDPVVVQLGEDAAEISVHGGPEVVRQATALLKDAGFADGGGDAADDGSEEGISRLLPLCRTELAVRSVLALQRTCREVARGTPLWWLLHPPAVAVVGRANAGKSTLVNALSGTAASIVADLPGTTRDYVITEADVAPESGGFLVRLMDTPGWRELGGSAASAADAIETRAMELAGEAITAADVVVLVFDLAAGMGSHEARWLEAHPGAMLVGNRSDASGGGRPLAAGEIAVSARTGAGLRELRERIATFFGVSSATPREIG